MKIIIITTAFLFYCFIASCQDMAFSNSAFTRYGQSGANDYSSLHTHRWHCQCTRGGEAGLIAGGAFILGALALNKIDGPNNQDIGVVFLLFFGVVDVGAGVLLFTGGEIYDHVHKNKNRYSIIGKQNQIGLAYNF